MIEQEQENSVSLGVLDSLVGYHMRRLSTLFATDFASAVGDLGLRQVLFGILSIVGGNPGINQGEVGKALGIQRANMVSLVNELVDRELLDRRVAAEDRRAFELRLTAAGERCVDEAIGRIRQHEDKLLSDLSPPERAKLIQLLSRIGASGG